MPSNISYKFFTKGFDPKTDRFSLRVEDSDYLTNETILNALVGNLVKYGSSGRIEPYLAESFSLTCDGKVWTYKLREGLECSDGTPITAESFVAVLSSNLKIYSNTSGIMDFELLEGWSDFKSGVTNSLSGLAFSGNQISFKFIKPLEDLNEFLRMPYFGFWRHHTENSDWTLGFVSSGPYTLNPHSTNHEIILDKRENWFSIGENHKEATSIKFSFIGEKENIGASKRTIIEVFSANKVEAPKNFTDFYSPPIALLSMVVSPSKEGPFKILQNRVAFRERIEEAKQKSHFSAKFFYSSCDSEVKESQSTPFTQEMNGYSLQIAFQNQGYSLEDKKEIERLVKLALEGSGAKAHFQAKNPFEEDWRKRLLSNREFDIRLNAVDIGSTLRNLVVKMIFCSQLGVCYPDPSNRICKLTKEIENNAGPATPDQISRFNQILYEDASIIQLAHYGTRWILSPEIDPDSFHSDAIVPLFEKIKVK